MTQCWSSCINYWQLPTVHTFRFVSPRAGKCLRSNGAALRIKQSLAILEFSDPRLETIYRRPAPYWCVDASFGFHRTHHAVFWSLRGEQLQCHRANVQKAPANMQRYRNTAFARVYDFSKQCVQMRAVWLYASVTTQYLCVTADHKFWYRHELHMTRHLQIQTADVCDRKWLFMFEMCSAIWC